MDYPGLLFRLISINNVTVFQKLNMSVAEVGLVFSIIEEVVVLIFLDSLNEKGEELMPQKEFIKLFISKLAPGDIQF